MSTGSGKDAADEPAFTGEIVGNRYAINVADLVTFRDNFPVMLLLQPLLTEERVNCEPERFDGEGVRIQATTPIERWEGVLHMLRKGPRRIPKEQLRIYEQVGKQSERWKRI